MVKSGGAFMFTGREMSQSFNRYCLLAMNSPSVIRSLARHLPVGIQPLLARNVEAAWSLLTSQSGILAVLAEHEYGSTRMIELLAKVRSHRPECRRVLITESCDMRLVIDELHSGAVEKLLYQPVEPRDLIPLFTSIPATASTPRAMARA